MTLLHVFILSIIEGITEFLPISSTAHLQLAEKVLSIPPTDFVKSFTIIIQVGALLGTALYILQKRDTFDLNWDMAKNIALSCVPTLVIGFVLYTLVKGYFFGNFALIAWALIIGGLIMMIADWYAKKHFHKRPIEKKEITLKEGIIFGFAQALAVIPGVSRSGAVLIAGYFGNVEKKSLAQFSFLIGLPIVFLASVYDVLKSNISFSSHEIILTIIGVGISGVFSYLFAGVFLKLIAKYSLTLFAWYRIVVGVVILFLL